MNTPEVSYCRRHGLQERGRTELSKYKALLVKLGKLPYLVNDQFVANFSKALKAKFKEMNDYFRFRDSPAISKKASKSRADAALRNGLVQDGNASLQSDQGLEQGQTAPGIATNGTTGSQGGVGGVNASGGGPSSGGDGAAAAAGAAAHGEHPSGRNVTCPSRMRDFINPNELISNFRERQPASHPLPPPSTSFSVGDFYNPAATQLSAMFPDFDQRINQIRNQTEVVVELAKTLMNRCRDLTLEKEQLQRVASRMVEKVPLYFEGVDQLIQIHHSLGDRLVEMLNCADNNTTAEPIDASPQPATPANGEEAGEEEQGPAPAIHTAPTPEKNSVIRLQGRGYLGDEVQISRIYMNVESVEYADSRSGVSKVPKGVYYFKNDFLALCGKQFAKDDERFKIWKAQVSDVVSTVFNFIGYLTLC